MRQPKLGARASKGPGATRGQCRTSSRALYAGALSAPGEREKAIAAGCDEFDTKPIEFDRLVATIRRILAARRNAPTRV